MSFGCLWYTLQIMNILYRYIYNASSSSLVYNIFTTNQDFINLITKYLSLM